MSGIALFLIGTFVTLIVAVAVGLLVWGAVLDGRANEDAQRRREAAERAGARGDRHAPARG